MKIAVIHDYADVFRTIRAFPKLAAHEVVVHTDAYNDTNRIVEQVSGFDALVLTNERVSLTRPVIKRLSSLKFVCLVATRASHVDVAACTEQGIAVSYDRAGGDKRFSTTAELTWGFIIASLRHLPYEVERFKQGHWQSTIGTRLFGRTLGIYAFGRIGSSVARVGRAFGMQVVCWGREGSTARARTEDYDVAASREKFFEEVDVLSLHLPLNKETRGIVTAQDLARMKSGALLVNTSRAPLIGEGALVTALQNGRPGFAAIDVYEEEPLMGARHPLLKMKNVLCTPHLGYAEREHFERKYTTAVEQLLAFADGTPIDLLNPDVARREQRLGA